MIMKIMMRLRYFKKGLSLGSMVSILLLSGCSGLNHVASSLGSSLVSAGESVQSAIGEVEAVQIDENLFTLSEWHDEPLTGFDSWAMRIKAKQVCHEGYIYESRHAFRAGELAKSHEQCVEGEPCRYLLEWRIQCKQVPYEPFSLFGKT